MQDEIMGLDYSARLYFKWDFKYIYMEDRFGKVSLTNKMEVAIAKCKKLFTHREDWPPHMIFYRDSLGDFAIVNLDKDDSVAGFTAMEASEAYSLLAILEGF